MDKIEKLKELITNANYIVFFGGAGVSTASGIKDFRSKDGLYNMKYDYPPETILSHTFFINKTDEFYKFYKDKLNCLDAKPNACHNYLTKLENDGKLKAIITQNIDGLHEKAKSKNIYELHGTIYKNYCMDCGKFFNANYVFESDGIPKCECGGIIKPDVVLYEEGLDDFTINESIKHLAKADLLIIAGTSLTVYPASGLINFYNGKDIVLINRDTTSFDNRASLLIQDDLNEVFKKLKELD
ncbi:MAG: NAD-dependent protein deacylase [Firmicutes bacterium]|nr:NAD-dependent protein deacylase [Bacillota bacterium]